jgi:hypothetical protein
VDIFDTLNSYGITITHLQLGILAGVAIFLIATYWKTIVIGIGMIFCFVVFAMPSTANTFTKNGLPENRGIGNAPLEYLEDCKRYTNHTETECKKLWVEQRSELDDIQ